MQGLTCNRIFLLVLLLWTGVLCMCASKVVYPCRSLIEKGKYESANQKLAKRYERDTTDVRTNYAYYVLYSHPGYSAQDYDKAIEFLNRSREAYFSLSRDMQHKLAKDGYRPALYRLCQKGVPTDWLSMHETYAYHYDVRYLKEFYEKYGCPNGYQSLRKHDKEIIRLFERPSNDKRALLKFIEKAAPYYSAYAALVRVISPMLKAGDRESALKIADQYQSAFGPMADYQDLKRILLLSPDSTLQPHPLTSVNSPGEEYSPVLSADEQTLYFTGSLRGDSLGGEDIYVSHRDGDSWKEPKIVSELSTSTGNEGMQDISSDATMMIIYRDGELCTTTREGETWSSLSPIGDSIKIGELQCDAMLTTDKRAILFVAATMAHSKDEIPAVDVYEAMNIFVSELNDDGSWGVPIDLGSKINTPFCDRSPYLCSDMKTLYFCSEGHSSIGGLDVFVSTRLSEDSWTEWSTPRNLGLDINTVDDNCWYRVTEDGARAYYSDLSGSNMDLYWRKLPER